MIILIKPQTGNRENRECEMLTVNTTPPPLGGVEAEIISAFLLGNTNPKRTVSQGFVVIPDFECPATKSAFSTLKLNDASALKSGALLSVAFHDEAGKIKLAPANQDAQLIKSSTREGRKALMQPLMK